MSDGDRPSKPPRLAIPTAALIVAHGGRAGVMELRRVARFHGISGNIRRPDGTSYGTAAGRFVRDAIGYLAELDLVIRDGDEIAAVDIGDLADWMADAIADEIYPQEIL